MLKNIKIFIFSLGIQGLLLLGVIDTSFVQAMSYCAATSFDYALNMLKKGSLDSFIKMSRHHLKNLKYQEVEKLRHTFEDYKSAFAVARELYHNKELQSLVHKMQAEVAAMPAQLMPEPGADFRPNISIYIEQEEKKLIDEFNIRHGQEIYWISGDPFSDISLASRALDILRQTTTRLWKYVADIQAKINTMSDQQVDRYFVLQEAKLDKIDDILQHMEDEYTVTCVYDEQRGLYRRDIKKNEYETLKCDDTFKLIKDISGTNHGQKWTVKAYESPDEIKIYVKNLYGLFDPEGKLRSWGDQLSFRVSIEGKEIQVVHDKTKNPEEGGYGPAGGFSLPVQISQELWPTADAKGYFASRFIDPIKLSDDEILLTIPKYKNGSRLYDWWHRRGFTVWTMPLD